MSRYTVLAARCAQPHTLRRYADPRSAVLRMQLDWYLSRERTQAYQGRFLCSGRWQGADRPSAGSNDGKAGPATEFRTSPDVRGSRTPATLTCVWL